MPTSRKIETHVLVSDDGTTAVDSLSVASGLSKQQVKQAMTKGAVWLSKGAKPRRLRRAKTTLHRGDELDLYYDEQVLAAQPPAPELIADERAYSIWFKPFGVLSQGSKWGDHCAITRMVEKVLTPPRPVLLVHRIDRAATGLIVVAHDKRTVGSLSKLFHDRAVEKRYRAVVRGRIPRAPEPLIIDAPIDGRDALSKVQELAYDEDTQCSVLDVSIETGRKHQIREHLAGIGTPILGDRLFGAAEHDVDLKLAAYLLGFRCPVSGTTKQFKLSENRLPAF